MAAFYTPRAILGFSNIGLGRVLTPDARYLC